VTRVDTRTEKYVVPVNLCVASFFETRDQPKQVNHEPFMNATKS
jgi:hypothetical protein